MTKLTKKKITEQTKDVVKENESPAAATLHAGSKTFDDPQSKVEVIAAAIGAIHAMKDDELTKWYHQMIAHGQNKGAAIPDGTAEKNKASVRTGVKEAVKADVDAMLDGTEGLTEEFKTKAATLFEAAVEARVAAELARIEEENAAAVEQQVNEVVAELIKQFDVYSDTLVKEWFEENKVAVEGAIRTQMTEDFIQGLKNLFTEHYIEVPEDKVDVMNAMAEKIDVLESRLNDVLDENVALQEFVIKAKKKEVLDGLSEGLTLAEATKLKELAENLDVEDLDQFTDKVKIIKESQFVKAPKKTTINESLEEADEANTPAKEPEYTDPNMKRYVKAITQTMTR